MKKLLLIAAVTALAMNVGLSGQTITVTSPVTDNEWCLNSTHTITWTKSGVMPDTVKIRLRRWGAPESEASVADITDSTANDGSSDPWTIPNTVAAGDYFIRVRTIGDPDVIGNSGRFHINSCTAPSITVTQPNGSDWAINSTHRITWTKSGTMPGTVKIRLRRWGAPESEASAADITDSTANDGSSAPWTIPNTVAAGDYFIRVRTTSDPDVIGNSVKFKITGFQTFIPSFEGLAFNDLTYGSDGLEFVTPGGYTPGYLAAHIKNQGTALIDRDVNFSVVFPEMVRDGAQMVTKHLYIPAGQERTIEIMTIGDNQIPLSRGILARVTIDGPLSQIPETNEDNNTREIRVAKLDFDCTAPRSGLTLSKLYMQGGDDFRVRFVIYVRHNLSIVVRNVYVHWTLSGPDGAITDYNHVFPEVFPGAGGEEWHVDEKYGKQGRANANSPKLREGVTYRVTYGMTDPGDNFLDVNPANDSGSFTFSFPD